MSATQPKKSNVIKCADCLHCKQFREVHDASGRYLLKVNCAKGHWRKGRKNGYCDLHRVMARRRHKCPDYDSMSTGEKDRREFLRDLAAGLPLERILYEPNGEPADIFEVAQ